MGTERRAGEIEKGELRDLRSSMGVDVETGLPPRGQPTMVWWKADPSHRGRRA